MVACSKNETTKNSIEVTGSIDATTAKINPVANATVNATVNATINSTINSTRMRMSNSVHPMTRIDGNKSISPPLIIQSKKMLVVGTPIE